MNIDTLSREEFVFAQNIDKQRIIVIGDESSTIVAMINHVLKFHGKAIDFIPEELLLSARPLQFTEAPVLLLQSNKPRKETLSLMVHIALISKSFEKNELELLSAIADNLPKSGILIVDDREPVTSLSKKERQDVLAISYSIYSNKIENGVVNLITSSNEKFPIKIAGEENLRNISAAKETLKRIGISSGQFYRAIATFTI
jgi:UDP-N-acetylmuramate: L-alanyl-gamma-D-glutamyl-meso-diaminopimelate ligase